jgi:hypothetical protein
MKILQMIFCIRNFILSGDSLRVETCRIMYLKSLQGVEVMTVPIPLFICISQWDATQKRYRTVGR